MLQIVIFRASSQQHTAPRRAATPLDSVKYRAALIIFATTLIPLALPTDAQESLTFPLHPPLRRQG